MKKMFIFVPAFGQTITAATFMTTHALQQALASKSIQGAVSTLSFPDIAELRSMAATIWYDTMPDTEYFLQIDADMGFSPEVVLDMILFDEPIVGAIYPQRRLPVSWAGSGSGSSTTERRGNFMQVEGVGMGCTLIRRDVMTKMITAMPELVDNRIELHPACKLMRDAGANRLIRCFEKLDLPERGIVSEDLSFCIRWNKLGGKVWAAVGYKFSHVGQYDYAGCYLEHIAQQEAEARGQQMLLTQQIPAPLLTGPFSQVISVPQTIEPVSPEVREFLRKADEMAPPLKTKNITRARKRNGRSSAHP